MSRTAKTQQQLRSELVTLLVDNCEYADEALEIIKALNEHDKQHRRKLSDTIKEIEGKLEYLREDYKVARRTILEQRSVIDHWIGACRDALNKLDMSERQYQDAEATVKWYEEGDED